MSAGLAPISFPAYETLRPVTDLAGVILCDNPSEMTFEGTNTVILRAPGSRTAVVVDPGPDDRAHAERIAAIVGEIELVVVTHRHGDHTDGIDLLREHTSAPVRAVEKRFCRDAAPLVTGGDDDEVIHAAGLDITVLATRGTRPTRSVSRCGPRVPGSLLRRTAWSSATRSSAGIRRCWTRPTVISVTTWAAWISSRRGPTG